MEKNVFKAGVYTCNLAECNTMMPANKLDRFSGIKFNGYRVLYRSESGRLGFDSDNNGEIILKWLLTDALAWDASSNNRKKFDSKWLKSPYSYLASLGVPSVPTKIVTYHFTNDKILKLFDLAKHHSSSQLKIKKHKTPLICDIPFLKLDELYDELFGLLPECGMIVVWNMFQVEANILTNKNFSFFEGLKEKCISEGIALHCVDEEKCMPQW